MESICRLCTSKCIICSLNKETKHCDCYTGELKNVRYNGNRDLYEKELTDQKETEYD